MFGIDFVTNIYTIILATIIVFAAVIHHKRKYGMWKSKGVPGPTPLPVIGTAIPFYFASMAEIFQRWAKKYGRIYGNYDSLGPVLVVSEPKLVKQICVKDFHVFTNREDLKRVHKVFDEMMFGARDDHWKRLRKIISPTFSTGKIKRMKPEIEACVRNGSEHLELLASNQEPLNLKQFWGRFTLEVIARCCFAMNINSHKDPSNQFFKQVTAFFMPRDFIKMIALTVFIIMPSFVRKFIKIELANITSVEYVLQASSHLLKQRKESNGNYNDFLQLLIEAGKEEENKSETPLTESEIAANCFLFFIAGYETTASLLNYFSYSMAMNVEIQEKLYEEIKNHFPDENLIDYDVVNKLPYLDAVVSETLRMYPPFVSTVRVPSIDIELEGTGIVVPAKTSVQVPVYAIHHDPEYYSEPELFNPERFLGDNRENIDPYTYLPFGAGPRNCVAMRFALIEAKLAIVSTVLKFRFEKTNKTPARPKFSKFNSFLVCDDIFVNIYKR